VKVGHRQTPYAVLQETPGGQDKPPPNTVGVFFMRAALPRLELRQRGAGM